MYVPRSFVLAPSVIATLVTGLCCCAEPVRLGRTTDDTSVADNSGDANARGAAPAEDGSSLPSQQVEPTGGAGTSPGSPNGSNRPNGAASPNYPLLSGLHVGP